MSLAQLLYPPPTPQGVEEWLHAHVRHHEAIVDALRSTRGVTLDLLGLYPLNPGSPEQMRVWNRAHQTMHTQMTSVVGTQGNDISGLDLSKKSESDEWFRNHFFQHQAVAELCGLPI